MMDKNKIDGLINHLEISRDTNSYEDNETGVELTKGDINLIINGLKGGLIKK